MTAIAPRLNAALLTASRRTDWGRHALAFAAVMAIALVPIWHSTVPMLADYPNHLARMHILLDGGRSRWLSEFYAVHWSVVPNLAMDLVVPALAPLVGLAAAGKLFLSLTLLLLLTGTFALHHTLHRRLSPWPFVSALLLYNPLFLFGVVNFMFGLGLALWASASWIHHDKATLRSWAIALLFACGLFAAHLSAFCFYALVIGAFEAGRAIHHGPEAPRIALMLGTLLPPAAMLLASPTSGLVAVNWSAFLHAFVFAKPALPAAIFLNYDLRLDVLTFAVAGLLVIRGVSTRRLAIHPDMRYPLAAVALAVLLMPHVAFGSSMADTRLMVALGFLFIASTDVRLIVPVRTRWMLGGLVVAAFLARTAVVMHEWDEAEQLTQAASAALDKIEPGKRIFPAFPAQQHGEALPVQFGIYLPCLAIISRDAFVPSLYALPGAQPVVFTARYREIRNRTPWQAIPPGTMLDWKAILRDYDYVWVAEDATFAGFPAARLALMAAHARFRLYRVIK